MSMTETEAPPPITYGNFTNRTLATTIDLCIILMVALPLADMILGQFLPHMDLTEIVAIASQLARKYRHLQVMEAAYNIINDPAFREAVARQHLFERAIAVNVVQFIFISFYVLPFWFRHSATPGKMLFRMEIRDHKTLERMSDRQAVLRYAGYIVSALLLPLAFLYMAFSRKRRGFHDLIAGTVVVIKPSRRLSSARRSEDPSGSPAPASPAPAGDPPASPPATE